MNDTIELKGLEDAWMEPDGTVNPVSEYGHEAWANGTLGCWGDNLEDLGWARLSGGRWYAEETVSQRQLDVIFDWHVANDKPFKAEEFTVK